MKPVFIDFETFYAKDYTLRAMTPAEYILDPRFEEIGCAVKEGLDGKPYWVEGPDVPRFFAGYDRNVAMGSHNWLFDGCILAWRYGYLPRLMFDTLGIARATLRSQLRSVSLKSVAKHLGLGEKGDTVHNVLGMGYGAIKSVPSLYREYINYSLSDGELCAGIFKKLVVGEEGKAGPFPIGELRIMDMVLRCCVEPRFVLDQTLLHAHLGEVLAEKETLLAQAMMIGADGKSCLMSNEGFAQLLRNLGVDPPMKVSPSTGNATYAFAKTDPAFLELAEHENPAVQVAVQARLGHKSTLEETRTQRFITISNLQWPSTPLGYHQGNMPMPIAYAAAHTHRLGGDWSLNVQNLRRGGKLRRALTAPPGYKALTVDASQIEAREVVTISGQDDVVAEFARGDDTYANMASAIFGFKVNKKDHPKERFVGKQARLGLGYQLWWPKFQSRVKTDSKNQTGEMIVLSDAEAANAVATFRRLNNKVVEAWDLLNTEGIGVLAGGGSFTFGPCVFSKEEILLPNGLKIYYRDLQQAFDAKSRRNQWTYWYAGYRHNIYGGKIMENIMQALARIHTLDAALRIQDRSLKELGVLYRLAQQAHDENVFIVRDAHVEPMKAICLEEMRRRPWWAPNLPLDAECGVGQTYGDAK